MEYWHAIETTTSGRPILRERETDILVDYSVGMYDGKSRVQDKQDGRVFLTSQRIIYVDSKLPTTGSVALELDSIQSVEYSSSFLKRSPRIVLFLREVFKSSVVRDHGRVSREVKGDDRIISNWVCPICAYQNQTKGDISINNDKDIICQNCGIPTSYEQVKGSLTHTKLPKSEVTMGTDTKSPNACPACTFINHPDMTNCELCGTALPNSRTLRLQRNLVSSTGLRQQQSSSSAKVTQHGKRPFVQLSFRKSDGTLFLQALRDTLDRRNKQTHNNSLDTTDQNGTEDKVQQGLVQESKLDLVGISGLEKSRENQLLKNDILFNSALSDMDTLISFAKRIEKLYQQEQLRKAQNKTISNETNPPSGRNTPHQTSALSIVDRDKFLSRDAFLDEIARDIYEYATNEFNDTTGDEGSGGVMITLIDLYAMYNKAMRIDTGFISPLEMRDACERFEKLGLFNLKLMKVNDRVLCLSSVHALNFISMKLAHILEEEPGSDILRISQRLNEQSKRHNWTMGALVEVLQYCVDQGDLVIDEQLSGVYYYINTYWK